MRHHAPKFWSKMNAHVTATHSTNHIKTHGCQDVTQCYSISFIIHYMSFICFGFPKWGPISHSSSIYMGFSICFPWKINMSKPSSASSEQSFTRGLRSSHSCGSLLVVVICHELSPPVLALLDGFWQWKSYKLGLHIMVPEMGGTPIMVGL